MKTLLTRSSGLTFMPSVSAGRLRICSRPTLAKNCSADPDHGGTFFNGHLEVVAHPHRAQRAALSTPAAQDDPERAALLKP